MIRSRPGLRGLLWSVNATAAAGNPPVTSPSPSPAPTSPVIPTAPFAGAVTRYDLVLGAALQNVANAVSGAIYPNGVWFGGTVTLTPSNGGAAISLTLPSSGTASVPFSYTPTAVGEIALTPTNTANLYNPYPAPLTVCAASSGTARTLSATLTRYDMTTYQRDTAYGAPNGFSPSVFTRGWGEVWISVTAIGGTTGGLFARLYDAFSSGASASAGTGTEITSGGVQVYGSISAGGTYRILLPASNYTGYYMDLATDAAFTNPVRIAQRLRVGVVAGIMSRSQESGYSRAYAYGGATNPMPTTYTKTTTWQTYDYRYDTTDCGWFRHDNVTADPYQYHYSESSSAGAMEFGRVIEQKLGVVCAIAGVSATGGGLDSYVSHDGTILESFTGTIAASNGSKFRYFIGAMGNWDGIDPNYPTETYAESTLRYNAATIWIAEHYPACGIITWACGESGVFGTDGSRDVGYTRLAKFLIGMEASNPMVASRENYIWNEFNSGHSTMAARVFYVDAGARAIVSSELAVMGGTQSTNKGPTLATTGTFISNARTIKIPYAHHGGGALVPVGVTFANPTATINYASTAEIAALFSVYAGVGGRSGQGQAIKIDTATINASTLTIDLVLTGSSGVTYADNSTGSLPTAFNIHYAADFGMSNPAIRPQYTTGGNGRGAALTDDRTDYDYGYGWPMRPTIDIAVTVS